MTAETSAKTVEVSNTLADVAIASGASKKPQVKKTYPKRAYVRSKVGVMHHLLQDIPIGPDEKKIDIDDFAAAQLDAGKWEIVDSE